MVLIELIEIVERFRVHRSRIDAARGGDADFGQTEGRFMARCLRYGNEQVAGIRGQWKEGGG